MLPRPSSRLTGFAKSPYIGAGWPQLLSRWLLALLLVGAGSLAWAADPQIATFTDSPDPVPAGGNVTYSARIDNSAIDAAAGVRIVVPVPSGATFVSATAPCVLSGSNVECDLGAVGANGADVRNLAFVFRALGPGTTTVTATATLTSANDTNASNNIQSQTTTVTQGGDLSLTKTGSPNPVVGGANLTYTLTASNTGPNASGSIVITDNLPPSVTYVSASGSGWTCSHSSGVVTCTRAGPHAAGAAIPAVTLVGRVTASSGTVTNNAAVAPASGGTADPDTSNNIVTLDTAVLPGADVLIAQKTVTSGTPATAGTPVTFQIQPRNGGPAPAANAVVTDTLPSVAGGATGWSVVSASGPNWSCSVSGITATCTRASLPVGATNNITIVATAPPNATVGATGTTYVNTASISSDSNDPTPGNNSGSASVRVLPDGADLSLTKAKTPNPVALGSNLTSTLRVTNNGPRAATGTLRVIDQLSAGETYVSSSGTGWSCTPGGSTVACDYAVPGGGLAVAAAAPVLSIVTQAASAGSLVNAACTGGSAPAGASASALPPAEGDPNATNDCAGASATSTTVRPDLSIAKTTSTPTGGDKTVSASEGSVTYTLVVTNATASPGTDAATGVRITDTVPAFIGGRTTIATPVVATPSAGSTATFGCAVSLATVTCTQTGGALAPGQTVTVPITVNRPLTAGTFTNTASVTNTAEGDPNGANDSASDTVTIEPIADIEVAGKTATPSAVRAGETATYVVSYRNNGPSPAASVALSDAFTFAAGDAGLTVLSIASSKSGSTCSIAAGAVISPSSPGYACTIGTLANSEAQTVTLVVRPNFQSGNAARSIGNTASIATTTPESPSGGDNGNNSRSATLSVNPSLVDLLPNKVDFEDPVPFAGNAFLNYRVAVTNNGGPSYATGVRITETMTPPAGKRIRFVCDTTGASSATCNAPSLCTSVNVTSAPGAAITFSCAVPAGTSATGPGQGDLAATQTKNIFLRFEALDQPAAGGDTYNNVAVVSANEPDSFPSNDSSDEQTTVRQRIDLAVAKSASAASVTLRQPFTWTVAVTNNGPGNSLQTDLTDTLPAGVVVTGPITFTKTLPAGSGTCTASGTAVSCPLGALSSGGVATISIPARIDAYPTGGTLTNTAVVDTDPTKIGGIDPVAGNNSASSTVTVTRSSLAGTVFQDRDRAGANAGTPQSAAVEPRVSGVSVRLTGTDTYGNAVDLAAVTDGSGNYVFDSLPPSNAAGYLITETQPAGYTNSPASPPASGAAAPSSGGSYAAGGSAGNSTYAGVVVGASVAAVNYNFPELRQASLSGFVYIDQNLNGSRDASTDPPVANATVRLLDAATGTLAASTTTGSTGAYAFTGLDSAVIYTLEEPLPAAPAGLQNGPVNPGLVNGAACAAGCTAQPDTPAAGTDRIASIDLTAGDGANFNFGERQLTAIAGLVYVDADRDNALTGADTARLANVTVRLVQGADCTSGTTLQTAATVADGSYRFDNVLAFQNYLVCETQPPGYGTGNAKGTPGSNVISLANLPSAGSADNHFGETLASLAGSVYQDNGGGTPANADNGAREAGEAGIANVTVTLAGTAVTGAAVNLTATTDAGGNFRFDGLLQSDASGYTVTEGAIPPSSSVFNDGRDTAGSAGGSTAVNDRIVGVGLGAGVQASGYLFGELAVASVSGTVYLDRNRSGSLDAVPTDGRLGGVAVTLRAGLNCAGAVVATTVTDASGAYAFGGVSAGLPYTVCETQPPGYADGSANPGTSATSGAANSITIAALPATGSSGNQFGELGASLAGSVYQDNGGGTPANADNGARDAGEVGIANVTVTLAGTAVTGAAVNLTATTDTNGNYRFDDLLQSDAAGYAVAEGVIPASSGVFNDGRDTAGSAGGSTAVNDRIGGVNLGAGVQAANYLFGELAIAPISGTVYLDRNRSGALDAVPTDGRIAGVTLTLRSGLTCAGAVTATALTDASGAYSFSGVSAGLPYTICETQPPGYADGTANPGASAASGAANSITLAALPAAGSSGNHFGELAGSVAGSVYLDYSNATPASNDNGARDAGEAGIAGVTVTLSGTAIDGSTVNLTATTDAGGNYRFDDLLQSDAAGYTVAEGAIPAAAGALLDGKDAAGSAGGSAAVNDRVSGIVLAAGVQATGYTFGELPSASLSGSVYLDRNRNGAFDGLPTDGGIGNVTVRLVQGASCVAGTTLQTTATAADGSYAFSGIAAGQNYLICETQPPGYAEGSVNPGVNGSSTAANAIAITNLPAGGSSGNRFGERGASLSGYVFLDANNDGARTGDAGLAGVTVTLTGTDAAGAAVNRSTTTDAAGAWRFDDLLAAGSGGYAVTEQAAQPLSGGTATLNGRTTAGSSGGTATPSATVPSAIAAIALAAGADATENDFGELLPSAIAGTVFIDLNNNGLQNAPGDTGLPGVILVVTGTDDTGATVNRSVTTGADGSYAVSGLRPGTYTVTEPTQPANTSNGLTVAGSAGGTPTAPAVTPSAIAGVALATPGTNATGYNFAELAANASLAGRVWLDADNDGAINGGEAGIAGVTVELTGTDLGGAAISRSTVTDAQGSYAFANLTPGTYTVREPSQPAGTLNGRTAAGSSNGTPTSPAVAPSAVSAISLAVGQSLAGISFGELPPARLSGRVFADNNNNGRFESTEAGIGNVTLRLTGTDDLGAAVSATAVTDAAGAYAFPGLRPGSYAVIEPAQPPGTVNGITVAGSSGGTATPPAVTPSAVSAVNLVPGAQAASYDFGEIGSSPDLVVAKASVEARFTVANVASYTLRVRNAGSVATSGAYTVGDRLPAGLTLDAVPGGTGWTCTGAAGAQVFSCTGSESLAAGAVNANAITAKVRVAAAALANSPVNNVALVEGGGEIDARAPTAAERDAFAGNPAALPACDPGILHNACRVATTVQAAASVSGTVWYDIGTARGLLDSGDRRLKGWIVEVVDAASNNVVARAVTADDGSWRVGDLLPGAPLGVRFRDPQSNVVWGYPVNGETAPGSSGAACNQAAAVASGTASSCAAAGANPALTVVLAAGQNLPQQSLPVDPSGVVYDSGTRQPVAGSVVTLAPTGTCAGWNPATSLVGETLGGYAVNGSAVSMTVGSDGYYQFLFSPAAPASCTFGLTVTPPAGYRFASTLIPAATGALTPPGAVGSTYAVQPQAGAPSGAVGSATLYYLTFTGGSALPNIVHNHLPLDADAPAGLSLYKTGDKAAAEVGDSVRYTVTVQKTAGALPLQTTVVDRLPAGFTYIPGTAMVGGVSIADPAGRPGPRLAFELGPMPASGQLVLQYRVRVGVGAQQGDGLNRARGYACNVPASCVGADGTTPLPVATATNEGQHRVRVSGGVFTTDACVLGKIFVDCNGNHVQDAEELGIPGVRLLFSDGTFLVSDSEGKYSYCGLPPRSHVLRVDPYTLPRGSRLTTTSNRNLADAGSLWLDLKNGELHRADFAEGSCSNTVLEQVKARRAQGEVRSAEAERKRGPALRFDSKAHGLDALTSPQQGTDGADQLAPKARDVREGAPDSRAPAADESNVPVPELPMNRPPPGGRSPGDAPGAATQAGGSNAAR